MAGNAPRIGLPHSGAQGRGMREVDGAGGAAGQTYALTKPTGLAGGSTLRYAVGSPRNLVKGA